MTAPAAAADLDALLTSDAVRTRARDVLDAVAAGEGLAFRLDRSRLDEAARLAAVETRRAYPDLDVPPHSRWRHFEGADGVDRWAKAAAKGAWTDAAERARAEIDLAFVSVLLDAGAGADWRYRTADGRALGRSEGLAAASLDMFLAGAFSSDPDRPWQVDADGLAAIGFDDLARGMQAGPWAPPGGGQVLGLDGRRALLGALAAALAAAPDVFGRAPARPGGLFDWAVRAGADAPRLLHELLARLAPIWPQGLAVDGRALGDCWRHPAVRRDDPTDRLLPFHKLTQWLVYSLVEPFERADRPLARLDRLTGLAEYRNGGLFVDTGVIALRDPEAAAALHRPGDPLTIEWRALTVALLDELAPMVRDRLNAPDLDLARILQGGTWAAGRRLAAERRPGAAPPFRIQSDGTVF